MPGTFRLVRNEVGFAFALFLATLAFIFFCQEHDHGTVRLPYQFGWAVVVTAVSLIFLDAIKYLDSFRTRPARSDLITLFLTLLLPFLILKQVFFAFTGVRIVHYHEIFIGLPFIALFAWCDRFIAGVWFEQSGVRRKVWMLLDGAEMVELAAELNRHGLDAFYDLSGNPDNAELVVISRVGSGRFENSPDLLMAHLSGIPVRDVRHFLAELRGREDMEALNLWFFILTATPQRRMFRIFFRVKSISEPMLAALLLVLFSPIVIFAAIGVKLSGPGPILYRQKRLGFKGKEFELIKFRSMFENAEAKGVAWAGQQASQVTPFGEFLRTSHFDEIPQLWNVIKGDMSFVGPRPERPEYYEILKAEIPLFWIRTLVRPGITGWAQVMAGYASSVEESREKLEFDLYYMKRMSPLIDLKILARTGLKFLAAKDDLAR